MGGGNIMIDGNKDDNSTLPISERSRDIVTKMKEHNLLSIGKGEGDSNTKDIYLLAVALGLDQPIIKMIKPESWTRTIYFNSSDKSLIRAALLATATDSDDIAAYCDTKEAFNYCKQLTDAGFQSIDEFASSAMYDPELMARKMLEYVDSIYDDVIKN